MRISSPVADGRRCANHAIKLHGSRCLCCGAGREHGKTIHVDHIKPRLTHPELQWELNNLQVLCEDCNMGKGAWDDTDWRDSAVIWGDRWSDMDWGKPN